MLFAVPLFNDLMNTLSKNTAFSYVNIWLDEGFTVIHLEYHFVTSLFKNLFL